MVGGHNIFPMQASDFFTCMKDQVFKLSLRDVSLGAPRHQLLTHLLLGKTPYNLYAVEPAAVWRLEERREELVEAFLGSNGFV